MVVEIDSVGPLLLTHMSEHVISYANLTAGKTSLTKSEHLSPCETWRAEIDSVGPRLLTHMSEHLLSYANLTAGNESLTKSEHLSPCEIGRAGDQPCPCNRKI